MILGSGRTVSLGSSGRGGPEAAVVTDDEERFVRRGFEGEHAAFFLGKRWGRVDDSKARWEMAGALISDRDLRTRT